MQLTKIIPKTEVRLLNKYYKLMLLQFRFSQFSSASDEIKIG